MKVEASVTKRTTPVLEAAEGRPATVVLGSLAGPVNKAAVNVASPFPLAVVSALMFPSEGWLKPAVMDGIPDVANGEFCVKENPLPAPLATGSPIYKVPPIPYGESPMTGDPRVP